MKKIIIQVVLLVLIIFLGYKCYDSIAKVQRFKVMKEQRYDRIVQRLKDIRTAQDAFKGIYNRYTGDLDSLINFIKNDSVKLVRSTGSLTDEQLDAGMTEADGIKKGFIIRDTIRVSALENVFSKDFPIENLKYIPFTNKKHTFKMGAGTVWTDAGVEVPVFEASVSNMIIFEDVRDEYNDALLEENGERLRLNKYPGLKVGSLKEANNSAGNWE